jgi:hypothetical protein
LSAAGELRWSSRRSRTEGDRAPVSLGLLRIEARRSAALPALLVIVGVSGWLAWGSLAEVPLWLDTSVVVRDCALSIAPVLAGVAAWMGGRERRRGTEDLLLSTARPSGARVLTTATATILWGMLAYALVGGALLARTWLAGAWGAPVAWPILTGLLAVIACGAIGFALGVWVRSRFVPPLAAITMFSLLYFPVGLPETSPLHWLTPTIRMQGSVYYGLFPDLGLEHTLFLTGLAVAALAAVVLYAARSSMAAWGAALAGISLVALGFGMVSGGAYGVEQVFAPGRPAIPHTPVCDESRRVTVCVHPAYESVLPELSAEANRKLEPLIGLPGVPERLEQRAIAVRPEEAGEVLTFSDSVLVGPAAGKQSKLSLLSSAVPLYDLVVDGSNPSVADTPEEARAAQEAISFWLQNRGNPFNCDLSSGEWRTVCEAAERFDRLGPARQRAWLEQNWTALRAGKLGVEDLP